GVAYGSWQKRCSARFVFDTEIKDWLKVGGGLSYTDQKDKQVDELGGGGVTMMRQVLEALPLIRVRDADGSWASSRDYPGMVGGPVTAIIQAWKVAITPSVLRMKDFIFFLPSLLLEICMSISRYWMA